MSRLIDADALKQHYAWWGECGEKGEENKRLFDEIIDLQPTVGEWVEAEERLPDIGTECIICVDPDIAPRFITTATYDGEGVWSNNTSYWKETSVTHWQPLLAPPEVE